MRTKSLYNVVVIEGDVVTSLYYRAYNKRDASIKAKCDMVGRQKISEINRVDSY